MARKHSNLARVFRHLPQSLRVDVRTVPQTRPWQILLHIFQFIIHYYPNIHRCKEGDTVKNTYL
jgi:hypothetical protein